MAKILEVQAIERTPYISSSFTPPRYPHGHEFFEISFCVTGSSVNTVNDVAIPFQNGTCVILRPSDVHSLTEYDPKIYEHIDLYCLPETFKKICNSCNDGLYDELLNSDSPIFFTFSNGKFSNI